MDIRPIKTDADYSETLRAIEALWNAAVGSEAGDRLDILLMLVERYEESRWPIDETLDPVDMLQYAIDELGHTQGELAEILGSRSRASEILNRRRSLTVEMIHAISQAWKISADVLVRPSRVAA